MTYVEFIRKYNLCAYTCATQAPDLWNLIFESSDYTRCFTVQGTYYPKPSAEALLDVIANDALAFQMGYERFCEESGFSEDSISAKTLYDAACANAQTMATVVGLRGLAELIECDEPA